MLDLSTYYYRIVWEITSYFQNLKTFFFSWDSSNIWYQLFLITIFKNFTKWLHMYWSCVPTIMELFELFFVKKLHMWHLYLSENLEQEKSKHKDTRKELEEAKRNICLHVTFHIIKSFDKSYNCVLYILNVTNIHLGLYGYKITQNQDFFII